MTNNLASYLVSIWLFAFPHSLSGCLHCQSRGLNMLSCCPGSSFVSIWLSKYLDSLAGCGIFLAFCVSKQFVCVSTLSVNLSNLDSLAGCGIFLAFCVSKQFVCVSTLSVNLSKYYVLLRKQFKYMTFEERQGLPP